MNINNSISKSTILTGTDGNDSIVNSGNYVTLNAMGGNDTISNSGRSVEINAMDGNDSIVNSGKYARINSGKGSDTISNSGSVVTFNYNSGDGNDVIYGFSGETTLLIDGGNGGYSTTKSGNDVIVAVTNTDDKITIKDGANLYRVGIGGYEVKTINVGDYYDNQQNYAVIIGSDSANTISNTYGKNVTIQANGGNDSISNYRHESLAAIDAGAGNDYIYNNGRKNTISGGDGTDTIYNDNANSVSISGGAGNDSINNNYGDSVTINADAGNDSINNNYGDSVTINADAGNDFISNSGWQVSIEAGAGDDSIETTRQYVSINGGAGNDSINNNAAYVSINGGAGNDSIYNNAYDGNTISGGTGNDFINLKSGGPENFIIYNTGDGNDLIEGFSEDSSLSIAGNYTSQVSGNDIIFTVGNGKITLQGGATLSDIIIVENALNTINSANNKNIIGTNAPDTIKNSGQNVTIQAKSGNDSITNEGSKVTIDSSSGSDTISNTGASVSIDAGNGYDSIYNAGSFVTIDADGVRLNYITNTANNVLITGGKDYDYITNSGSKVTIAGGADNDSITNSGSNVLFNYSAGDGDDEIYGFNENSTLSISGAEYSTKTSDNDIIVKVGDRKITLSGAAALSTVHIFETPININNTVNNTLITGKDASDTIKNSGQNVTIQAKNGDDSISNTKDNVTISGGAGNDTLWNDVGGRPSAGKEVSLNGGAGNDFISNDGDNSTVQGGADADTIQNFGSNVTFSYANGDGNDVITGFNATSTLSIAGGQATTTKSGSDIIVTVGDGKITLKGAATLPAVNIVETPLNINNTVNNTIVTGTTANDTITNWGSNITLNAMGGNDTIRNIVSNVVVNGGSGSDSIRNENWYSTINGDAGNDYIYNSENCANVMINGGADNDSIENDGASITVDGGAGNDFISNNAASVVISGGADNDSIQNTGKNTTVNGGEGNDSISNNAASVMISGGANNDSIQNTAENTTIDGAEGDDFISNSGSNVTILGNEGNDTISLASNAANNLIRYYSDNGNDVIQGFNETSTLVIADKSCTSAKSGSDIVITIEDTDEKITLKGAATLSAVNIDALLDMENTVNNTIITGSGANDYIENIGENVTINALGGDDTIDNSGSSVTIDGGTGNDSISNSWNASGSIIGGAGNDTIENAGSSVTVDGSTGNDFISNEGKNAIISGNAGDDSIDNWGDNVTFTYTPGDGNDVIDGFKDNSALSISKRTQFSTTKSGSDVIVTIGENKITLQGAASLSKVNITVPLNTKNTVDSTLITGTEFDDSINNDGEYVTINALGGNDSIYNDNYYAVINADTGNDSITNEAARATIDLSTGNDSVLNWSDGSSIAGGEGNDYFYTNGKETTINAGKGDDYIRNLGANVFRYAKGDGNDAIHDEGIKENATLDIYKGYYNSVRSGENIIVTVGDGQITLSNEKGYDLLKDIHISGIENVRVNRTNRTNNISIAAADYDDRVINYGSNVTIITSGGKDTIDNRGSNVSVDAGTGNDSISNSGSSVTILGNEGNDLIQNSGSSVTITGAAGNDTISNSGDTVTIDGGADNDSIANRGHNVSVDAGEGNDSIINGYNENEKQDNNTINAGDGDDYIYNYNDGDYTTLLGDKGNDTIHNNGDTVSIDGGEGNDYIYSYSFNGTIAGGTGNDTISLSSSGNNNVIRYREGDGKDVIYGFKENSMLDIDSSNYALIPSGSDIIVRLADGEITVKGAMYLRNLNIAGVLDKPSNIAIKSNNTLVFAGNYDDTISNSGQNVTIFGNGGNDSINSSGSNAIINGGYGNDSVINSGHNATIDAGAGKDYIYNNRGDKSSIDGGAGDDTINNRATSATILGGEGNDSIYNGDYGNQLVLDGGAGNDRIKNTGSNNSISGGAGNDYIDNSDNRDNLNNTINAGTGNDTINNDSSNILFQYKAGDGNDIITGFNTTSTLSINGGARDDTPLSSLGGTQAITTKSGNDIIVTVGDGKVTLKNAANLSTVNIVETPLNINNNKSNATVYGTNTNDTIINTGDKVAILALKGKDSLENNGTNVSVDAGAGNDFISNNGKNATLSGSAGNDSISNHSTRALLVGGADNDSIFNNGRKNTISGGDGNDSIENYKNSEEVSISGGAGNDSIRNAGNKVTLSGGAGNDTIINDYGVSNLISGEDGSDLISIQGAYRNSIIGGTGNDTINLDWASTRTLIQYNIGDGSDLIEGFNATSTLQIGNGNETYSKAISGDDIIITVGEENITLKGAADLSRLNIVGVVKLNINNTKNEVELTGGRLDDSVVNSGNSVTISTGAGNDTVENSGRYVSISGGADADYISSNKDGDFVSIDGADGNDKISVNGGFRSYIEGGKGDDSIYVPQTRDALIQYNAGDGNDYIEGFNSTSTLQLGDGTDTFSKTVKGGNVIITTGEGQITLAGAASVSPLYIRGVEEIAGDILYNHVLNRVIDGTAGNDTIRNAVRNATIAGNGGRDYITNVGYNVSVSGGIGNDTILNESGNTTVRNDGESITLEGDEGNDVIENRVAYVSINGGEGDDSISSYRSNNTIIGGTGNDTIYNNWNFLRNTINYGTAAANVVFNYTFGDGNDIIYGFNNTSTLNIAGSEFTSAKSGDDIIITMGGGNVTLKDAAKLDTVNVVHTKIENPLDTVNTQDRTLIVGTSLNDSVSNKGKYVTIQTAGGNDSIYNTGSNNVLDAGRGNDSIHNDYGLFTSISGGAGNDLVTVTSGNKITVNAGTGEDKIYLNRTDALLLEYNAGDGNDYIYGFNDASTLNIAGSTYTLGTTRSGDVVISVGADTLRADKITLDGAAKLSTLNIINGTYVNFAIEKSGVTYKTDIPESVIKAAYQFNKDSALLTLDNSALKDYAITVENDEKSAVKVNWNYGSASLSTASTLEYQLDKGKNVLVLTSNNYGDKIAFSQNAKFSYEDIEVEVQKGSAISTKSDQRISFDNNSFANVTASEDTQIDIGASRLTVNDVQINSENGAGTITVNDDGMSFTGYGVQFADLEIAKESYFGKLSAMTATYNSDDESYTLQNTACIKTLADDFTKITFDISAAENYAYYKVNDVEFLIASDENDINVVETDGTTFKILDKEIDAENIGRITLDEQITFSGTQIDFDGVQVNYTHNKPVSYSLDGEEITLSDAATIETGDETKNFKCEAGSYVVNGRSFETTADLTFTADANEIQIPLNDAATEIYFDGVQVSGISDGSEIVFDLANDEISIPDGAIINFTSHDDIKLNLAAGNFTIDDKRISIDSELEITANKESLKVPLSEEPVTIRDAKITGNGSMTIDNTDALFFSILLPDGAFVENTSNNTFELAGKDSSASFGDENKKVVLTEDGTAYIKFENENGVGIGFNTLMFEHVEIEGVDAWTVETSGTSGIDKITGITDGATVSTSTQDIDAGDLRFEVETSGAGEFTIAGQKITTTGDETYVVYGNSDGEIKVAPLGEEYADDDSEAAGKVYNFDKAGDYTVNGITFHATENSTAQTITRGVELDLSSGTFQYDGLTLSGNGTAQINRYNAKLVSLTDGATVSGSDASKYNNRQFEIEGAVELIGKKFESNEKIRCALLSISDSLEFEVDGETVSIPFSISGFIANDKYVQIHDDCYKSVTVVDKKISSIEGVKNSAEITGNGLANVTIVTTESGEFSIHGRQYTVTDDSDGVTFLTGSHGNVIEIKGLEGSVEGDFENEVSVNGKAIHITGASSVKVTSDGENITEISNVAGDLVTTDGKSYRKNVRVYETGGAEELKTSADGIIIFNGNKFKTNAGKTFTLDEEGNVSGIEEAQLETANASANVAENETSTSPLVEENFATINLSTTDELEEVFGDFSEGLTVNGVFVKVTDSTNFVVKNDAQNVYIETTAHDTFNINGKTFTTSADKTIFKLDESGNVSEIVTDSFYPDKESYLIEGNFNDEIIFNGQKFCVTGTNDTSIFLSDESLITIKLARNNINIIESGGVSEIALSGAGEVTIGDKVLSTSDGFVGTLRGSFEGIVDSVENFVGTIEGKLGGLELNGTTINSEDNFNVTGDGEKITAIENLQNGSVTGDNLDGITINGEKISVDDSDEVTLTITDGKLKTSDETTSTEEILDKLVKDNSAVVTVNADNRNVTLKGGEAAIVEDTSAKVNVTASKGQDTIYTSGSNVDIDLKAGGATEIFAAQGRATVENYKATSGAAFLTENENIADAIEENSIAYDDGRLNVNSARVTFTDNADSRTINFVDATGDLQKVGFVSDDSKIDASKETGSLILVGGNNSTIAGGKGHNQIYLEENGESTIILNGKNTVDNFNASFEGGDKVSVSAANSDFSFDGENVSIKSGAARALIENISSDAARILTLINGKETKTAIAQEGGIIATGDDLADAYYGEKSGVDFSNYENSLTVDLRENFNGINRVTVGGGLNTLISSSANETLTGNGTTEFIFDKNSGRDVINNFDFDEDKINVGTNAVTNVRINSTGGVRMEIGGNAVLTLDDAQGKNFKINEFTALVDENLTYNATANYFVATAQNASLTVGESAEIWLDGSHGKTFNGDIRTLDASTAQGRTSLAGNDLDNRIFAGQGDATLWGGNGGNDFMQGGAGKNTFFYLQGNGSDTIVSAHDGDIVYLSTVTLDQISGTSITADAVSINFKDGGSLQVNSAADITYQLADGSRFSANHAQSTWLTK